MNSNRISKGFWPVRIIISNGDHFGQPFYIKTAYPFRSFDDIDACYDAIDDFQARKMKKKH